MAKDKDAWRKRRWKLFKQVYNNDSDFREKLANLHLEKVPDTDKLDELLLEYKIPTECRVAVILFILRPKLKDADYLKMVVPPFHFANSRADTMGPSQVHPYTPAEYLKHIMGRVDSSGMAKYTGIDTKKINYKALAFFISEGITTFHIFPFVKKQELHELIDEYWDEIEPLLNNNKGGFASTFYSDKLLEAVYEPKTLKHAERDKMIMELSDQPGISDKQILYELAQQGWDINEGYLRKIRSELRNKK